MEVGHANCFKQLLVATLFRLLALSIELSHGLLMVAWGLGLPLLFWHGLPRLSRAFMWFSIGFILVSVASHLLLGECVLTSMARYFWQRAGGHREHVPFVVLLTNRIAGVRPSARAAVLAWEFAILAYSVALLLSWKRLVPRPEDAAPPPSVA
jgi:hypothetical protein